MHLLIAHNAYGQPSGEEQALAALTQLLTGRGHRVSSFERRSADIGESTWRKVQAAAAGIDNPFERDRMRRELARLQPDVVLAQNLYPFLSPSILQACRERQVPVVMRCSNYRLFCPSGLHLSGGNVCERCLGRGREWWCVAKNCEGQLLKSIGYAARTATARLGGRILKYVRTYIVLTEFQKQRFMTNGIPASRLAVIGNHLACPPAPAGLGRLVTFLGRVAPEKGIADFLELARRLPALPFAVAGAVKPAAEALLRARPANVKLLGHLSGAAMAALLADSRIVVAFSRWYEGFPNAVLEAMAAGRAVLASNLGGLPEIVDHARTGLLVQPGDLASATDQLRALYADPARCLAYGAAGRAKVESQYHPERAYEAYMDVFTRARLDPTTEPACDTERNPWAVSCG